MRTTLIAGLLVMLAGGAAAQTPKYEVVTKADKSTDFSALKTYVWEPGWQSYDVEVHQQIIAAVDRELAGLGFTKGTPEACDVTVVYATVRRDDVDLKTKERTAEGLEPRYPVVTIVVLMREPGTHKELFRARADAKIELDIEAIRKVVDDQVAKMFARYPTRLDRSSHK